MSDESEEESDIDSLDYEDLEKEVDSIMYGIFGSTDGDTDTDIIDVDTDFDT